MPEIQVNICRLPDLKIKEECPKSPTKFFVGMRRALSGSFFNAKTPLLSQESGQRGYYCYFFEEPTWKALRAAFSIQKEVEQTIQFVDFSPLELTAERQRQHVAGFLKDTLMLGKLSFIHKEQLVCSVVFIPLSMPRTASPTVFNRAESTLRQLKDAGQTDIPVIWQGSIDSHALADDIVADTTVSISAGVGLRRHSMV